MEGERGLLGVRQTGQVWLAVEGCGLRNVGSCGSEGRRAGRLCGCQHKQYSGFDQGGNSTNVGVFYQTVHCRDWEREWGTGGDLWRAAY